MSLSRKEAQTSALALLGLAENDPEVFSEALVALVELASHAGSGRGFDVRPSGRKFALVDRRYDDEYCKGIDEGALQVVAVALEGQ